MNRLHCKGCGRTVGFTNSDTPPTVFCNDPLCKEDFPVGEFEDRDSLIEALAVAGTTMREIGGWFGISHQRASQIARRSEAA